MNRTLAARRAALGTLAGGALAIAGAPRLAHAQDDKGPISLMMGFGASMDYAARVTADLMRESLGRPVVPIAKVGAGGRVMLAELKRAAPDGRVLGWSTSSPFAIYPHIYTKLDYDPVTDFTPIAAISWFDIGIAVSPQTGITDLKSLIEFAKKNGNELTYGASPGTGSSVHFMGIALALATGIKLNVVPYKDTGQGLADLVTNRIPVLGTGSGPMVEMHRANKIRIIVTSGEQRAPQTPEVPTLKESGLNLSFVAYAGLFGPAKMPADLVARLQASVLPALARPDVRDKLAVQGMVASPLDSKQFADWLAAERERFKELARASGYVPEAA